MDRRIIGCIFFCIAAFLWIGTNIELAILSSNHSVFGTLSNIPLGIILASVFGIAGLIYIVIGEVTAIRENMKSDKIR